MNLKLNLFLNFNSFAVKRFPLYLLILIGMISCKEDQPLGNLPPETKIFLTEIDLSGQDRLNSVVTLHWSAEDKDGYIAGYELSLDEVVWNFVTIQDSTFRFDLQANSDTTDIDFWVRAIDGEGLADPTPAYLLVPIKNTPPVAKLDTIILIPDTVYSVFSSQWRIEDLDGVETLDSIFIKLNGGAWYPLPKQIDFVTVVPSQPEMANEQSAILYTGRNAVQNPIPLEGLLVGAENRLYLQARDIAGSLSDVDTSNVFFVKRKDNDLLVIDDHSSSTPEDLYRKILGKGNFTYDFRNLAANNPPFWDPTFGIYLNLYDEVFWFSDGTAQASIGSLLHLEVAANQLQVYLNQGGKLFATTRFPTTFNSADVSGASAVFGFSPMDSISSADGQARIPRDSLAEPQPAFAADFPTLICSNFISGADPFYAKDPANDIYYGQFTTSGSWQGPATICGRTVFTNGRTNQVFFSVELHKLNGDSLALESLFNRVLRQEFDW